MTLSIFGIVLCRDDETFACSMGVICAHTFTFCNLVTLLGNGPISSFPIFSISTLAAAIDVWKSTEDPATDNEG